MMAELGAQTKSSMLGVDTSVHLLRPGLALTLLVTAPVSIKLMASAAAMSRYIALAGHALSLVIYFLLV
jgi:hypothetical protein